MKLSKFSKTIIREQTIKYIIIFSITAFVWGPIREGLINASNVDKLEPIAVIMGIISLCALTGYFAFSYAVIGKTPLQRFLGYLCALFLTVPLILTWMILYFTASIWVPEMRFVWGFILFTLYLGTFLFDNLDLLRMGRDVAAISFYEKGHQKNNPLDSTIELLKQGQRLAVANLAIGQAIEELGIAQKDKNLREKGAWIIKEATSDQHIIDRKVVEAFKPYAKSDPKIRDILNHLESGLEQHVADLLIASLLERVSNK